MLILLVLSMVLVVLPAHAFECVDAAVNSMRSDDKLLEKLSSLEEPASIDCLGGLIRGNHFKSVHFVIDTLDVELLDEAIEAARNASSKVQAEY